VICQVKCGNNISNSPLNEEYVTIFPLNILIRTLLPVPSKGASSVHTLSQYVTTIHYGLDTS